MVSEFSCAVTSMLRYDIDLPVCGRQLHVISDPCSHAFEYSIGSSLWQAAIECLEYFSGLQYLNLFMYHSRFATFPKCQADMGFFTLIHLLLQGFQMI